MTDELKKCPFCEKHVEIKTHPEWDEKVGLVYGAMIIHKNCFSGMEMGIFSVHYKKTEEEAHSALKNAWNRRTI
jgi:hypothetical protein